MAKTKVTPKKKVDFTLFAPEATEVQLAGDFTEWEKSPLALKKNKDGTWKKTVTLPTGVHQYRYLVDGQWCNDPTSAEVQSNSFGSENNVRVVE